MSEGVPLYARGGPITCQRGSHCMPEGVPSHVRGGPITCQRGSHHMSEGVPSHVRGGPITCQTGSHYMSDGVPLHVKGGPIVCQRGSHCMPEGVPLIVMEGPIECHGPTFWRHARAIRTQRLAVALWGSPPFQSVGRKQQSSFGPPDQKKPADDALGGIACRSHGQWGDFH
jgi:hypothetical protein